MTNIVLIHQLVLQIGSVQDSTFIIKIPAVLYKLYRKIKDALFHIIMTLHIILLYKSTLDTHRLYRKPYQQYTINCYCQLGIPSTPRLSHYSMIQILTFRLFLYLIPKKPDRPK